MADKILDLMRSLGMPDPGNEDAYGVPYDWHEESDFDEEDEAPHPRSCSCEDCMQNYPERFDSDWNNFYAED